MYKILPYADNRNEWDTFNEKSKNGTFLFNRSYMEYHKDRFQDASLLIYNEKDQLKAIFPANRKDETLFSHEGLTYGGLISNITLTTCESVHMFSALKTYLQSQNIKSLIYKTMPQIYLDTLSQEDQYALFLNKAQLKRRDVFSVVDFSTTVPIQERRERSRKKAEKAGLIIEQTKDFQKYWDLLSTVLLERHNVNPTHSLIEIIFLSELFPKNIQLYICRNDHEIFAGVVLYINKKTVHAQYISTSKEGATIGALDLLFFTLLEKFRKTHKYFSFGISNENNGLYLNEGLIAQKEGFGARSVIHDTYHMNIE